MGDDETTHYKERENHEGRKRGMDDRWNSSGPVQSLGLQRMLLGQPWLFYSVLEHLGPWRIFYSAGGQSRKNQTLEGEF
jgi:hypothetical protein